MKFFGILFFVVSILVANVKFDATKALYKTGNYEQAFKDFTQLAKSNDLEAAYMLAMMYEKGKGCEVNEKEAMRWYKFSSQGYYERSSFNTTREIEKEQEKIYEAFSLPQDKETAKTVERQEQSLYNIKAHKANYFLPMSHRTDGKYASTNSHEACATETEFQVSIKYDFASDIFDLGEIYTVAYTQLSFWQVYEESAYFRETNYNPEFIVSLPFSELYENDYIKAMSLSFAHQSNGRGGEEERSWNSLNTSLYFQYGLLFTELKLWKRLADATDYNPDLIDYMGHGHLKFTLPYKKHIFGLLLRNNFSGNSATEMTYSYPVFSKEDLFFYVKYFNGYGESLIDYNNNVNKIGIGFSISR